MQVRQDNRPLYLLVKERLEKMIADGSYQAGEQLPPEAELARLFGVSRATLREALRVLEEEGVLTRKQGIGTFVNQPRALVERGIEELFSVTESIEKLGQKAGSIIVGLEQAQADKSMAEALNLPVGAELLKLSRLRTADNKVAVYCIDYIPKIYTERLPENASWDGSLFSLLESQLGIYIEQAIAQIVPINADENMAKLMHIRKNSPLLLLKQIHFERSGVPIFYCENYFRPDFFNFKVIRKRK